MMMCVFILIAGVFRWGIVTFLTNDKNQVENGNKKWTQRYLPDTAVSVQVVIDFSKHKETAALKIEATVSLAHEYMAAVRRLFFFCRRPADF